MGFLRWLVPLGLVFVFFNLGSESFRGDRPDLTAKFSQSPLSLLWPPWQALQMYVSFDGDERLYWYYTQLALGQPVDLRRIAERRSLPVEALRVGPGSGARLPHRDFSVEYPPLVWTAILPPALVTTTLASYRLAFGLWACLIALGAAAIALAIRGHFDGAAGVRQSARRSAWLAFAIGPLFAYRYDALPALATVVALWAALRHRWGWAGVVLGLGAAAKVYPLLLVPVLGAVALGAGERRGALKLCAAAAVTPVVVLLPLGLIAGRGLVADLSLLVTRPLQLEAVLATPLLFVPGAQVVAGFGSYNLDAPGAAAAAALTTPLLLGLVLFIAGISYRAAARGDRDHALVEGAVLAVAAILCAGKVFSPQFVIWLWPLVVAMPGPRGRHAAVVLGVCALLAQVWHPFLYPWLRTLALPMVLLLALRNVLLVLAFVAGCVAAAAMVRRAGRNVQGTGDVV